MALVAYLSISLLVPLRPVYPPFHIRGPHRGRMGGGGRLRSWLPLDEAWLVPAIKMIDFMRRIITSVWMVAVRLCSELTYKVTNRLE